MKRPVVLVGSQDGDFAWRAERWLRELGLGCERLESGARVVARVTDGDLAAVVLDCDLRGMTAPDVLGHLRRLDESLPVVMVGPRLDVVRGQGLRAAGADRVLVKPVVRLEFVKTIIELLDLEGVGRIQSHIEQLERRLRARA